MPQLEPGDRVLCTNGVFRRDAQLPYDPEDLELPVEGGEYTIRDVVATPRHGVGVRLVEVVNQTYYHDVGGSQEPVFAPSRFRRVAQQGCDQ